LTTAYDGVQGTARPAWLERVAKSEVVDPGTGKMHSAAKDACLTFHKNSMGEPGLFTAKSLLKKFREVLFMLRGCEIAPRPSESKI
jgi:hypothetical protein